MIRITLAGREPPKTQWPYKPGQMPHSSQPHAASSTTVPDIPQVAVLFKEAARRDRIVKDLYASCKYVEGDTCVVARPGSHKDKYGDVLIERIAKCYTDLGKDVKWPEHDRPMIVTGYSADAGLRFWCTPEMLVKKEPT